METKPILIGTTQSQYNEAPNGAKTFPSGSNQKQSSMRNIVSQDNNVKHFAPDCGFVPCLIPNRTSTNKSTIITIQLS